MLRVDAENFISPADRADDGPESSIVVSLTPLLLTIRSLAVVVGISERKIRSMMSVGSFPAPIKGLGRMSRWRRTDVEFWVASLS